MCKFSFTQIGYSVLILMLENGNISFADAYLIYVLTEYADMAELADAPDLGSGGRPCRFDSCYPHE